MSTLNIKKTIPIAEGSSIDNCGDNILFYKVKYGKIYLYSKKGHDLIELPNFYKKFGIITQVQKHENFLVVFYAANYNETDEDKKAGIYVYDIDKKVGRIYCNLLDFSANCNRYLDFINFSFDPQMCKSEIDITNLTYVEYLKFIVNNFGLYAMIYYLKNKKFSELENREVYVLLNPIISNLKEILHSFPSSIEEYDFILKTLSEKEIEVKDILNKI